MRPSIPVVTRVSVMDPLPLSPTQVKRSRRMFPTAVRSWVTLPAMCQSPQNRRRRALEAATWDVVGFEPCTDCGETGRTGGASSATAVPAFKAASPAWWLYSRISPA